MVYTKRLMPSFLSRIRNNFHFLLLSVFSHGLAITFAIRNYTVYWCMFMCVHIKKNLSISWFGFLFYKLQ